MSQPPEDSTSACVHGAATNVQARQSADEKGAPTLKLYAAPPTHLRRKYARRVAGFVQADTDSQ